MNTAYPNPSNILPLEFKIKRQADILFTITVDDATPTVTGWTWQLFVKKYKGARTNIINLTLGYGLSYEIYSDTILRAHFTSDQTDIEEADYYWELVRTDIEKTWAEGKAIFTYDKKNNLTGTSSVSINVDSVGTPVTLQVISERIITVNANSLAALGATLQTASADTPLDADTFNFYDAVDAVLKKVTWSNIKATLKTYFDTVYKLITTSETALVDGATIDIAAYRNTLSTSSATRTFTISWTGDFFVLTVTLSATTSTFTWPANALCINSDGTASGDNTMTLDGVSGDVYEICGKDRGATYSIVCKNFGQ